jgi:hypothetical protein
LSATFKEDRLGGIEKSNIHFRVRLKQCQIVVFLPERGNGFRALEKTIDRTTPPPPVQIVDTEERKDKTYLNGMVELGRGLAAKAGIGSEKGTETNYKVDRSRQSPRMEVLYSKTADSQHCWIVTGVGGALSGSLWEAASQPRFVVSDRRPPESIQSDRARGLPPMSCVEVRCQREDIEIYDIKFKDLSEQGIVQNRANQDIRLRAAEAFLKSQIQIQGLRVGDISDKFSEVFLAEYLIPLFEEYLPHR